MDKYKWIPYTYMDINSQCDMYFLDTRDFYISAWDRDSRDTEVLDTYIQDWLGESNDKYVISLPRAFELFEEIRNWKLEKDCIILHIKQNNFQGWLKYIRLKKVSENKYIVYTTVGNHYYPIDWRNIINTAKA